MSLQVLINAVDRTANWFYPGSAVGEAVFERRTGGPAPGTFVFYDLVGSSGYRPTTGQSFQFKDGGTAVYEAIIIEAREDGITELDTGVQTTVTTSDLQSLPARVPYTVTYPAGTKTHKQILQDLVAGPLAVFGISLDAGQATGAAAFDTLVYDATPAAVLNDLQARTGWPWRIMPGRVLKQIAPGGESSGLSLSDATPTVQGLVSLQKARNANYGNMVALRCGPTGTALATQRWTADGVHSAWVTDIAAADPPPALVLIDNGVTPRLATVGPGAQYTWDRDTHTLTLGTDALPAAGTKIVLGPKLAAGDAFETDGYTAVYPFTVTVSDAPTVAAEGPWVLTVTREDLTDYDAAASLAPALLAQAIAEPWIVTVEHRAGLAWPGQTIALSFAERQVSGTYMIQTVRVQTDVDGVLVYTMDCVSGSVLQRTWVDYFKDLQSGGSTVVSSGGVTTVTTSVLASPFALGGSRNQSVAVGTTSTPVVDWQPFYCPADMTAAFTVTTRARDVTVTVTPRIERWSGAAWVTHVDGTGKTGTSEQDQDIVIGLLGGVKYRLCCYTGTAGASAYCIGQVRNPS